MYDYEESTMFRVLYPLFYQKFSPAIQLIIRTHFGETTLTGSFLMLLASLYIFPTLLKSLPSRRMERLSSPPISIKSAVPAFGMHPLIRASDTFTSLILLTDTTGSSVESEWIPSS